MRSATHHHRSSSLLSLFIINKTNIINYLAAAVVAAFIEDVEIFAFQKKEKQNKARTLF